MHSVLSVYAYLMSREYITFFLSAQDYGARSKKPEPAHLIECFDGLELLRGGFAGHLIINHGQGTHPVQNDRWWVTSRRYPQFG